MSGAAKQFATLFLKDLIPTCLTEGTWTSLEGDLKRSLKATLSAKITGMGLSHGNINTTSRELLADQIIAHLKTLEAAVVA